MRACIATGLIVAAVGCGQLGSTTAQKPPGANPTKAGDPKSDVPAIKTTTTGDRAAATVGHIQVDVIPVRETWFAVWVTTKDGAKSTQFTPWTSDLSGLSPLRDDLGNKYLPGHADAIPGDKDTRVGPGYFFSASQKNKHRREFTKTLPAEQSAGEGQVTAGRAKCDVIAYQPLAPKATKMILELPAKNLGGDGVMRFEFDAAKVKRYVDDAGE